ncbi:MAG TPA: hypothetical protein VF941_13980, partial [Clostridia bacterium]
GESIMYEEIITLAKALNKRGIPPSTSLKRNSVYYSLISYINHTIAFFISEDYDAVAIFIKRADEEINRLNQKLECKDEYFELCHQYLNKLTDYLLKNKFLSKSILEWLPDKLKKIKFQRI